MMKAFRPLWSLNIKKTEKWLNEKGLQGYVLKDVNILSSVFSFEKCESKKLTYRICYENKGAKEIQRSLKRDGWNTICHKSKWFFINNEKETEGINAYPSRGKLLKRIRILGAILYMGLMFYGINTGIFLLFLLPLLFFWILGDDELIMQKGY